MSKNLRKDIAVALITVMGFVAFAVGVIWVLNVALGIGAVASVQLFQAISTVTLIVVGGIMAYRKLQIFRDFEPHLTITHDVSHRFIGDQYVHILVTANLYNSSKVVIRPRKSLFLLLQLSPIDDDEVERLYKDTFIDQIERDVQWPLLDQIVRTWGENKLIIEPGETHKETREFIVYKAAETVMVKSFFYNPDASNNSLDSPGWGTASVYDIILDD